MAYIIHSRLKGRVEWIHAKQLRSVSLKNIFAATVWRRAVCKRNHGMSNVKISRRSDWYDSKSGTRVATAWDLRDCLLRFYLTFCSHAITTSGTNACNSPEKATLTRRDRNSRGSFKTLKIVYCSLLPSARRGFSSQRRRQRNMVVELNYLLFFFIIWFCTLVSHHLH